MLKPNPYTFSLLILTTVICFSSCDQEQKKHEVSALENKYIGLENEDSVKLTEIRKFQDGITLSVSADAETDPVSATSLEDAADDPAIWVNPQDASRSMIFGSNKRGGIVAYNLRGIEQKYYPTGRVNNIDILDSLVGSDSLIQLLGCSNRSSQSIDLYFISGEGTLIPARKTQLGVDGSLIDDVYGFCLGTDLQQQKDYLFVNGKNGNMLQYELQYVRDSIELLQVRMVKFGDQTEGMVVDSKEGMVYIGAENTGVWKLPIDPTNEKEKELLVESTGENPFIKYDIEGLTIAEYNSQRILMVSSQGNFSYALFNLSNNAQYLGSIKIGDGGTIDGTEDTDGIDVETLSLGKDYPNGIFVVQDGYNFQGDTLKAQNFKYIDFSKIQKVLDELL